jgi:hypothetical protein
MPKKKADKGVSVAGYFRPIFQQNPKLLKQRSNEPLYERWLKDHPGEKEVPAKVRQGLSNLKSVLRAKRMRRGRLRQEARDAAVPGAVKAPARKAMALTHLEMMIDEVLIVAKALDREGLDEVIRMLRTARNRVIVKVELE